MKSDFLQKLQKEAEQQKVLHETRLLPQSLDFLTSFIGNNSLLVLFSLSLVSALFLQLNNFLQ